MEITTTESKEERGGNVGSRNENMPHVVFILVGRGIARHKNTVRHLTTNLRINII